MREHLTVNEGPEAVGWPFPWWGLLVGGVFLGAMFTPLALWVGILPLFGGAMLAIPFIAIGTLIGGDAAVAATVAIGFSGLFLLGVGTLVRDIVRATSRRSRSALMNRLVLFILLTAGLAVSAYALSDAWVY